MKSMTMEVLAKDDIELCRTLCDELMAFQKSKAVLNPECFDTMSFDTRMKRSFDAALRSRVIVVKDDGVPVGYAFSTVDDIRPEDAAAYPDWAPKAENAVGFYPAWVPLPQKIGCLSNLYLREGYRRTGWGKKLLDASMDWLSGFGDVSTVFVFISNGNEAALRFYQKHGFTPSHDVFGGFIQAAYKQIR